MCNRADDPAEAGFLASPPVGDEREALERENPGTYGDDSGLEDYHKVGAGFRRWLAEVKRAEAARAFAQGVEAALDTTGQHGLGLLTLIGNPYAAALGLTVGQGEDDDG